MPCAERYRYSNHSTARHAPNHHRTEPARFYLLNREQIIQVAQLMAETIKGDGQDPILVERAEKENVEQCTRLTSCPSFSDSNSDLFSKNQNLIGENYATTCCNIQIFSCFSKRTTYLQMEYAFGWKHPQFKKTLDKKSG